VTPSVFGYDPGITPPRSDLAAARWLLADAGYPHGLRLRLDGPNNRYVRDVEILREVARQLARAGIDEANTRSTMTERNQSMGRAIARVSELHAVIPLEIQPEAIALSGKIAWDPPINFGLRLFDR